MAIIDPCNLGPALPSGVNPAFIYTRYPEDIDDPRPFDADGLPIVVDLQTPVKAESLNRHRESILAIEGELGIQPSGTFNTVRDRLDAIEEALCTIWNNVRIYVFQNSLSLTGDLPIRELNFTGTGVTVSQDVDFADNGRVNIDVTGGSGSQGPQGNQGAQGVVGAGAQGVQGNQGSAGVQGNQGNQGLTGSGNQGVAGVQGNQGNQGVGVQGTQGVQGMRGVQGSIGFQGNQGNQGQGNQGNQGADGYAGSQGAQGNQGMRGYQGNQGNQGTRGYQGFQGALGNQGNQGLTGSGTQGNQGDVGSQGNQGNQGIGVGTPGAQGNQGNQGNQGIQGLGSMPYVAIVSNYGEDNITPLRWDESVWVPGITVSTGTVPYGVAITPDGLHAIVVNRDSNNITPLTRNGSDWIAGIVVSVGTSPNAVAIAPDGLHAIVTNANSDNITPLTWNGSEWIADTAVSVGTDPTSVAITSDGYGVRAIVANWSSNNITPLTWNGSVWVPGTVVSVGTNPTDVAITADGYRAIVTNSNTGDITPLTWSGSVWVADTVVSVALTPSNVAITPDGLRAIVASRDSNTIVPLTWSGSVWVVGVAVSVGTTPIGVAIAPDGLNAIVANFGSDNITPLTWNGSVWVPGTSISVGMYPYGVAITQSNYGTVGLRGAGYYSTYTGIGLFIVGSQTFTLNESGLAYRIGDRIRAIFNNQANQYVDGLVTSYSGMSLTLNVDTVSDPGSYAIGNGAWSFGLVGAQGNQAFAGIGSANTVYWSNGVANSWSGEPTLVGLNAFQYVAIGTTGFGSSLVFTNTSITPIIFQNFKSVSGDAESLLMQAQCNSNTNGNGGDLKLMGGFGVQSHGDVILQTPSADIIGAGANNLTFSKAAYGSTIQSNYQQLVGINNSGYGSCAIVPIAYEQTSPYPRKNKYYGTFGLVGTSQIKTMTFSSIIHDKYPLANTSITGKMLLGWTGNADGWVSAGAAIEFLVSIFVDGDGYVTHGYTSLGGNVPSDNPTIPNGFIALNKNTAGSSPVTIVPSMPEVILTVPTDTTFEIAIRAPNNTASVAQFYWEFEYGGLYS